MIQDRLGTNRAGGARFYPYGEEITGTSNDRVKFGTYTRDGFTGLDYADQRYYGATYGRFGTPDPSSASMDTGNPGSWNRYAYVLGDPVNANDPTGLCDVVIGGITQSTVNAGDVQGYANDNSAISVYPYSASSNNSSMLNKIGNAFDGVVQVAAQAFGANSSTYAAVEGVLLAAQDGGAINVTTFSGGAAALTAAVKFLNANGASDVVNQISNITYVAPGNNGDLYNNGNVAWISGGLANGIVAGATSIPQTPAPPTFYNDENNCGHNFGCLANEFYDVMLRRSGDPCSNPTIVNQPNNSRWQRMFILGYGDPFWYIPDPPPSPVGTSSVSETIRYY